MTESSSSNPLMIAKHLLSHDPFSMWMGLDIIEAELGYCKVECAIRKEMVNGFGVTHGGIIFSLADTALAFSAATYGRIALAIDNSISFMKKSNPGQKLTASSRVVYLSNKTAVFDVNVRNENLELISKMKGTVYRSGKEIEIEK